MHTNYDVKRMAFLSLNKMGMGEGTVLEMTGTDENGSPEGIGLLADMEPVSLDRLCGQVKKAFFLIQ